MNDRPVDVDVFFKSMETVKWGDQAPEGSLLSHVRELPLKIKNSKVKLFQVQENKAFLEKEISLTEDAEELAVLEADLAHECRLEQAALITLEYYQDALKSVIAELNL